jgi:hypothetical protein
MEEVEVWLPGLERRQRQEDVDEVFGTVQFIAPTARSGHR